MTKEEIEIRINNLGDIMYEGDDWALTEVKDTDDFIIIVDYIGQLQKENEELKGKLAELEKKGEKQ